MLPAEQSFTHLACPFKGPCVDKQQVEDTMASNVLLYIWNVLLSRNYCIIGVAASRCGAGCVTLLIAIDLDLLIMRLYGQTSYNP